MFKNLLLYILIISLARSIEAQGFFDSVNNVQIINMNESYTRKEFKPVILTIDNKYRFLFKYNHAGEITEELKQIFIENKWENKSKKVFSYNEVGRIISLFNDTIVGDKLFPEFEVNFTYNDKSELISVPKKSLTGSGVILINIIFFYTDRGQLSSHYTYDSSIENYHKESMTEYTYNRLNNIENITQYSIYEGDTSKRSNTVLRYNKNNQLINSITYKSNEGISEKTFEAIYGYDESGNLVSDSLFYGGHWGPRIRKYVYDDENRITSVSDVELYDSVEYFSSKSFYSYNNGMRIYSLIRHSDWNENELNPHFKYQDKTLKEYDTKNRIIKETNEYFNEDSLTKSEIKEYRYSEKLIQVIKRNYELGENNIEIKKYHFMDKEYLKPLEFETTNENGINTVNNEKKFYIYDEDLNCIGGYSKILFDSSWRPYRDVFHLPGMLNMSGYGQDIFNFSVEYDSISCTQTGKPLYNDYFVQGNYPIIFPLGSSIEFNLPKEGKTEIELLELNGKVFSTIYSGELKAGYYKMIFPIKNYLFWDLYFRVKSGDYISDKYKFKR